MRIHFRTGFSVFLPAELFPTLTLDALFRSDQASFSEDEVGIALTEGKGMGTTMVSCIGLGDYVLIGRFFLL